MLDTPLHEEVGQAPKPARTSPARIFIDGESGTTGLQIRERLETRNDVELMTIAPEKRKDVVAKREILSDADLVILCLPDAAARETVALIDAMDGKKPRIIDASTAHRTAPGWVFGFPEMAKGQADAIRAASKVSNPGCYPTGAIALVRPLVDAGLIAKDQLITVNAVSGYSGGGKSMIEAFENGSAPSFELYGLGFEHKHVPELQMHSGLAVRPIFIPSVGNFRQGMLVCVPLHLAQLPGKPTAEALEAALRAHYGDGPSVRVVAGTEPNSFDRLEPESLNGTNQMELRVAGSRKHDQVVLIAKLDNLGKGASGAAVQSIELMLGLA